MQHISGLLQIAEHRDAGSTANAALVDPLAPSRRLAAKPEQLIPKRLEVANVFQRRLDVALPSQGEKCSLLGIGVRLLQSLNDAFPDSESRRSTLIRLFGQRTGKHLQLPDFVGWQIFTLGERVTNALIFPR